MKEVLQVNNLTKTFILSAKQMKIEKTTDKKKVAVNNVSFSAYEGEIFGLLGPNGAGKSTFIRTILGLIQKSDGSAEIFGKDIEKHKIENLRRIGYLPSESALYKDMRVRELLKFSANARKSC